MRHHYCLKAHQKLLLQNKKMDLADIFGTSPPPPKKKKQLSLLSHFFAVAELRITVDTYIKIQPVIDCYTTTR